MAEKKYNFGGASGTFDGVTAGAVVAMPAVYMGDFEGDKVADLSALVVVDAETDSITVTPKWQVSNDNSTYDDVMPDQTTSSAGAVIATGTSSADATVRKVVTAPRAVYGFKYARLALAVGVTDGITLDTYAVGYNYRSLLPGERT